MSHKRRRLFVVVVGCVVTTLGAIIAASTDAGPVNSGKTKPSSPVPSGDVQHGRYVVELSIGPVAGLTIGWHPAPVATAIPQGTTLQLLARVRRVGGGAITGGDFLDDLAWVKEAKFVWSGAEETWREGISSLAECELKDAGAATVQVAVVFPDGVRTQDDLQLQVVDIDPSQITVGAVSVTVEPFDLEEDATNAQTMGAYFGESIATLHQLFPTHYLTSVGRALHFSAASVNPPEFAPLIEWRFDQQGVALGLQAEHTFTTVLTHRGAVGPLANPKPLTVETYATRITSHVSGFDRVPEGEPVTFTAERTYPEGFDQTLANTPGMAGDIVWLSSTKYGTAEPTLGHGPTFTAQFDNTVGPDGAQWLGVKSDNTVFGQDQKGGQPACLALLVPREAHIIGGTNVMILAAVLENTATPPAPPTLEISLDGITYESLPAQTAPDLSPGSTATTVDVETLPSGPVYVRATSAQCPDPVIHQATIDHLPQVNCAVSGAGTSVDFDCSASTDPDGAILEYQWDFADGSTDTTPVPFTSHQYAAPGTYDLEVTECDDLKLCNTQPYELVVDAVGAPAIQDRAMCGCEQMTISTTGDSFLKDPRRLNQNGTPGNPNDDTFDPAPRGKDPKFVSFNFEIGVQLKDGSDPNLCQEGQNVKRTAKYGAGAAGHKKACTAGRDLPECNVNADCDTHKCVGGTEDGKPCDDLLSRALCLIGGGSCVSQGDGVCTEFPFAGAARGNDDYRAPAPKDQNLKLACPKCKNPDWLDFPGMQATPHAPATENFRYDADFVAFENGDGDCDCSCHFNLVIDWDGANQTYRAATGLTLIQDAETKNCVLNP